MLLWKKKSYQFLYQELRKSLSTNFEILFEKKRLKPIGKDISAYCHPENKHQIKSTTRV